MWQIWGDRRSTYHVLVKKSEGKKATGKLNPWWKNNIKMDLQEVAWQKVDFSDLAQDRNKRLVLVNTVTKLPGSLKCGRFLGYFTTS
jgi:hypothetical protein